MSLHSYLLFLQITPMIFCQTIQSSYCKKPGKKCNFASIRKRCNNTSKQNVQVFNLTQMNSNEQSIMHTVLVESVINYNYKL